MEKISKLGSLIAFVMYALWTASLHFLQMLASIFTALASFHFERIFLYNKSKIFKIRSM